MGGALGQGSAGSGATANDLKDRRWYLVVPWAATIHNENGRVRYFVFEGFANKEIAELIGVSEGSVKSTLQQLFSKTGVRTRSQLVRIVLEQHRDQI